MNELDKKPLHDLIQSGEVDIEDMEKVSDNDLDSLKKNFGFSYEADGELLDKIFKEIERRKWITR